MLLIDVTERVEHARSLARSYAELQRMQQRLIINEKMASLGVLVAGVNHEINNPLAYTTANLRSATESVRSLLEALPLIRSAEGPGVPALQQWAECEDVQHAEADVLNALRDASEGASRISELVSSMRRLTRPAGSEAELDLAECARAGLKIGRTGLKPGVEIHDDLALKLSVRGDASELARVVTNLVVNAGQSMGDAGKLTLRAFEDGDCAVLEIADSGPGVPAELRARIFDPFFTTRSPGQGTGLGLAISLETARRHNGELQLVDAHPGATFRLRLPLATRQ